MSKDILTGWLENSNGGYFTPKTFDTLVFMKAASDAQGKLVDLPTYFQEAIFDREIKIDLSHNNTCAFGSMEDGSWPGVTGILGTANGGTGNSDGYIRTGAYPGSYIGSYATAEGDNTFAWGQGSHIEGGGGYGNSLFDHEGLPEGLTKDSSNEDIIAGWRDFGFVSDAGGFSLAKGIYSHVEGNGNLALGSTSHAQGKNNLALGDYATVGGYDNEANGEQSFAFGSYSKANGKGSFALGQHVYANGENALAIGEDNTAEGKNSFVMGYNNTAHGENSFIIGKYAKTATDDNLAFAVGNGTGFLSRSNAFTIDWDGNTFVKTRLTAADVTINNGLSVTDIEVGNNVVVSNDLTVNGKATIAKQLTVSSEGADITGPTFIKGALGVSDGAFTAAGDATIGGNLSVAGISSFTGLLTAISGINAQAASTFDDTVTIGKDLTVAQAVSISNGLTVGGDATIAGYIANATWNGQVIATSYGGTGVNMIAAGAIVCGGGLDEETGEGKPIVQITPPGAPNYFLVSGSGANTTPSYQLLDLGESHNGSAYNLTLKLNNSSEVFDTIAINGADTTSAGLVTTSAQTFAGNKTFTNDIIVEGYLYPNLIKGSLLLDAGESGSVGTLDLPWESMCTQEVLTDDITSAFGSMRISNDAMQIEMQDNKMSLTSSQVHLNCGAFTLSSSNYGYQLPASGVEGQVFFLLLEE